MKTLVLTAAGLGALLVLSLPTASMAADAANGQAQFRGQCGVCHTAGKDDGDGGQGPSLAGVIGRKAGGDPNFGAYTQALSDDKDVWTEANLAAFLENPQKVVPGTAMPVRVGSATDRADIAAYLATVKAAP
jgi:cytochrome c2